LRMKAVRRETSPLGLAQEGGDLVLAFREVVDRAEVDRVAVLFHERGQHGEADHRKRDDAADDRADAESGALEEDAAREALARRGLGHRGLALVRGDGGGVRSGLSLAGLRRRTDRGAPASCDVACPEGAADDEDHCANRNCDPADDQPYEKADDADGKADRPEARRRLVPLHITPRVIHPTRLPFASRLDQPLDSIVPGPMASTT